MNILSQRLPRFLLTAALLYVAWYFFYNQLLHAGSAGLKYDKALCNNIAEASAAVLRSIGYKSEALNGAEVHLSGWHVVNVGWQCDGLPVMALFAGFIIAYPGPWRAKLWFVPLGMLLIHGINVLRVAGLALNHLYSQKTMYFNHHYTYTIIVYGFIFWLWTIWVQRFASPFSAPTDPPATGAGPAPSPSLNG